MNTHTRVRGMSFMICNNNDACWGIINGNDDRETPPDGVGYEFQVHGQVLWIVISTYNM